jgi:ADP-ribosylglycohydrolase
MFRILNQNTTIIQNINNGELNSSYAMPQKDITSDGTSFFSMGRQQYIRTEKTEELSKKKWYGSSKTRDSTRIIQNKTMTEIGKGSLNLNKEPMRFAGHNDINTTNQALIRVRHLGCAAPAKKIYKNRETPIYP